MNRNGRRLQIFFSILLSLCAICRAHAQELSTLGEQKPFALRGSVSAATSAYADDAPVSMRDPYAWSLHGSITPSIYDVQFPLSFTLSSSEKSFRQPFNQFGISPSFKSITAHLGYRSMSFSRYGLAGMTFFGVGIDVNPGELRAAAMYGRFQRAVEPDTTRSYDQPAYARTGFAFKLGYGTRNDYFDLSFLSARDDASSITIRTEQDPYPVEDLVFAVASRWSIVPELSLEIDGGASLYTRNLRSAPLDLDTNSIPTFLINFVDARGSTSLALAGRSSLNFVVPHFGLRLGVERIDPEYTSLGAYAFTTDLQNWTIAPSFDLFDYKLRVSGSIGLQHDNLLNTKEATTNRVIGSAATSWNPNEMFGIDAQYTNYSTDQSVGRIAVADSFVVRNVTTSGSIAPRMMLQDSALSHMIGLVASYQQYTDQNEFTRLATASESKTATLMYTLTFLPSSITTGASLLYSDSHAGTFSTQLIGVGVNGSATLVDRTLTLRGSLGYSVASPSIGTSSITSTNENLSASYRMSKDDVIAISLYATQNSGSGGGQRGSSVATGSLSYSRSFSTNQ